MSPLKVLDPKDHLVIGLSASALQQDGIQILCLLIFISIFSQRDWLSENMCARSAHFIPTSVCVHS